MYTIENDEIRVSVSAHGAELTSIVRKSDGKELLWNADESWWKRHSPVLFPIVGSMWEGTGRIEGKEYHMGQHGFARDSEFEFLGQTGEEIRFVLVDSEDTRKLYPYGFRLEISYELKGSIIYVKWLVRNTDSREISFQIGAHPAFAFPDYNAEDDVHGYLRFDDPRDKYPLTVVGQKGCVTGEVRETPLGPVADINAKLFEVQTIIVEGCPMQSVTLIDLDATPWLKVTHNAPVIGIWAPVKNGVVAPFVCIEPWYGRCDTMGYTGDFADRPWINRLMPGEEFLAQYQIEIL